MGLPTDFQGLIDLWPTQRAFGREVAGDPERGRVFHRRNRVPKRLWPTLIQTAGAHGIQGVTLEYLRRLYDAGRYEGY